MEKRFGCEFPDAAGNVFVGARDEHVVVVGKHRANNLDHLVIGLALAEHGLGKSLPDRTMVVHVREFQILEWKLAKPVNGIRDRQVAVLVALQDPFDFFDGHVSLILSTLDRNQATIPRPEDL